MNFKEFKALFPIKGKITKEILESSNILDIFSCVGAKTLQEALGVKEVEGHPIGWGVTDGGPLKKLDEGNGHGHVDFKYVVGTKGDINMMRVDGPMDVTFILTHQPPTES